MARLADIRDEVHTLVAYIEENLRHHNSSADTSGGQQNLF